MILAVGFGLGAGMGVGVEDGDDRYVGGLGLAENELVGLVGCLVA